MIGKLIAGALAVLAAAAVTVAAMICLIKVTTITLAIENLPLRILAVAADIILGTLLLLACIYLTTRLAVRILGVGQAEFPPLPDQTRQDAPPRN